MASKAACVLKLHNEIKHLETIKDGIKIVKSRVHGGECQLSAEVYTVMDIVHRWVEHEIPKLEHVKQDLMSSAF